MSFDDIHVISHPTDSNIFPNFLFLIFLYLVHENKGQPGHSHSLICIPILSLKASGP